MSASFACFTVSHWPLFSTARLIELARQVPSRTDDDDDAALTVTYQIPTPDAGSRSLLRFVLMTSWSCICCYAVWQNRIWNNSLPTAQQRPKPPQRFSLAYPMPVRKVVPIAPVHSSLYTTGSTGHSAVSSRQTWFEFGTHARCTAQCSRRKWSDL